MPRRQAFFPLSIGADQTDAGIFPYSCTIRGLVQAFLAGDKSRPLALLNLPGLFSPSWQEGASE